MTYLEKRSLFFIIQLVMIGADAAGIYQPPKSKGSNKRSRCLGPLKGICHRFILSSWYFNGGNGSFMLNWALYQGCSEKKIFQLTPPHESRCSVLWELNSENETIFFKMRLTESLGGFLNTLYTLDD